MPDSDVYPIRREDPDDTDHELGRRRCWCGARVEQVCPACRADEAIAPACARCGGKGWVPEFTEDPEHPSITIHEDVAKASLN